MSNNVVRDITAKDRSTAFLVFGFLFACYLLTYTGYIDSSDGLSTFATTESLVRRGAFDSNQLLWMGNQQGNIGVGGDLYTRKGLGMVLLAAPLAWFAWIWPVLGLVHTSLLLNPLFTAWTGALLFRAGRRLGWQRSTACLTALLYGLATMAWPYTQGYFSDPVCAWGLFAAGYGLLAAAQSGRRLYLFGSGIAWGIAYLARPINLMTLPIYLVGLFVAIDAVLQHPAAERWQERLRAAFWAGWRPLISFLIPVVAVGVISLWWNWVRFGSLWDTGYVESESFSANWLWGLFGLTIGPARGFLWYNPILLLAVPGAVWFWRHERRLLYFCLALVGLYTAVYAKWYMWHGGYSWGPRFLVAIVPFLALLAGPAWFHFTQRLAWGWLGALGVWLLALVSIGVQWLGLLVPYGLVQDWLAATVTPLFAPVTFWDLPYSPLVATWRYLTAENIHLAWWRGAPWPATVDWFGLAMPAAGVLVGVILLVQLLRTPAADEREDTLRNWLYGGALWVIALAMLTYFQLTLVDPQQDAVARRIAGSEEPADAILHLTPNRTQAFANSYGGRLPAYGFFDQEQLNAEEGAWLARLEQSAARLWVAPDYRPPERSGWERALRTEAFLLLDERVTGGSDQRIALYAMEAAQTMTEAGVGTVFGDPEQDGPVTEDTGWFRLNGYALTPKVAAGEAILLTLLWQDLQPVDYNYHVFVHLVDVNGNKVAQRDGQPVQWLRPTSTWAPGEEIADRYGLLLPAAFPRGRYTILVGMYDPVTGQRLPVSAGPSSYAIEVGPIEVN